ncbi:hypothetical protein C3432_10385 [Citrobacter amalonaticus]|uniref:YncE family protein n=1 Tax=Citrobacter amalonaticus TaxID=35703 RepID=A0A2S4S071_CITAM|nr:hypothetical protein [Citrobacter amalonaticus]POT58301.1 hypothetical protein C3432_10385 [Citrobacter amalonaticus]POT76174.1 hypothetical protein C3436_01435 [Citrobacter amalonaticus]POU66828.1 hypothetical protein C3430_08585 [Citrobacter amalonaticus]POV05409.1 hypothetical protein C3424_08740 [Citrobacter amalonaticus]
MKQLDSTQIQLSDIERIYPSTTVVELVYSDSQQALFVSAPDWQDESQSRVLRINPQTLAVEAEIALAAKGFGVALDDTRGLLYLTQGFNGSVAVVDITQNRLIATIPLMESVVFEQRYQEEGISGERLAFLMRELARFGVSEGYPWKLRELVFDPLSERLFLPGLGLGINSVLLVIDTRERKLEKVIPGFGYNVVGITLDSDGRRIFISNMQGQLFVVDPDKLEIVCCHEVAVDQLLNMVYDPRHNRLIGVDQGIDRSDWRNNHLEREYVPRSQGHEVFILNADTAEIIARMTTDEIPIGLAWDGERERLYVANRRGIRVDKGEGTLTVFDTVSYTLLQRLPLYPHPNSFAFDTDKKQLFITVKNDETLIRDKHPECVARLRLPDVMSAQ